MQLAVDEVIKAKWTDKIHEEWITNLLQNRPDLNLKQLLRTKELMNLYSLDCLIEGFEDIIPTLNLPDFGDRHVLAAAIYAKVDVILTFNTADFPENYISTFSIKIYHPDNFLLDLLLKFKNKVVHSIKRHRKRLKYPPKSADEYLETLSNQKLMTFSKSLLEFKDQI